jgi:hypothetical protein
MSLIFVNRWVVALALGAPMVAACSKDPCFPESKGKQYQITVVERWDTNSQFPGGPAGTIPCPVDFDLMAGSSFVVQVDGFRAGSPGCSCGEGSPVQAPTGWTWQGTEGTVCQDNFFALRTAAEKGVCRGDVSVGINAARIPTGAAVPGQPPAAHLERWFQERAPTCGLRDLTCIDSFVVEIQGL